MHDVFKIDITSYVEYTQKYTVFITLHTYFTVIRHSILYILCRRCFAAAIVFVKIRSKSLKNLCNNFLYQETLMRDKKIKNFPKGLKLQFNLALYKENHSLQQKCNFILRAEVSSCVKN